MNFDLRILMYFFCSLFGIVWMVSTLLFSRTSLKYIERKLADENRSAAKWDKNGWGLRITLYASLLAKGNPDKSPLLESQNSILANSRPYDRVLAKVSHYSFILMMIPVVILVFIE